MTDAAVPPPQRLSLTAWLIVFIASIGFMFDIYELLMLPLVLPGALPELIGAPPGSPRFQTWVGLMFFVPALAGGAFGLIGGYLTDRLGRRRVLTGSILLYAFSAFAAGFSTSIGMLFVLRILTFVGVCVEFVAATAWLAELFPNPTQREKVLGYSQAFSSFGGLLVAVVNGWIVGHATTLPAIVLPEAVTALLGPITDAHAPCAYTLMSGLIPAIPLIVIRPFLPESPVWQAKKEAGTLRRPSFAELFSPALKRTTIVTTLMIACSYGAAFGAIEQLPQIVGGLADVKARIGTAQTQAEEAAQSRGLDAESIALVKRQAAARVIQATAADYTKVQEVGGLTGRFLLAILAVGIVGRRLLMRLFQVPGLIVVPAVFFFFLSVENRTFFELSLGPSLHFPITTVSLGMFLCGLFTVAQFSFWGNYLPRVYPVHLRGTGESFAANIGGRMIGTSFALVTTQIAGFLTPANQPTLAPQMMAYTAAGVALFVYLCGFMATFFLPEPQSEHLPE